MEIQNYPVEDQQLIAGVMERVDFDKFSFRGLTMVDFRHALETMELEPTFYFKVSSNPMKIGLQLTVNDYDTLKKDYNLYQDYRDPRLRDSIVTNIESVYEGIIRAGRMEALNSEGPIEIDLSQINLPFSIQINNVSDIPSLKWQRPPEHQKLFSQVFFKYLLFTLKRGWTINPEIMRLLNIVDPDVVQETIANLNIFVKSRIVSSLQRLADIIYLTNFGALNETIHATLIDDMFEKPIENRKNLPQSDATDAITFLNFLKEKDKEFEDLANLCRKIGVLTKPVSEEAKEFRGFDTAGDAIREILAVIHFSMNHHNESTMISTIYETITDPDFSVIILHFFDPTYELLQSPFLTMVESIKERIRLRIQQGDKQFSMRQISEISGIQNMVYDYMARNPSSKDLLEIWSKVNNFLAPQVVKSIEHRTSMETLELIRGKEIILNIMTPLLLAKFEGRGFNPLASQTRTELHSRMKNITGVVAIASNFRSDDLKDLLSTMFKEAPELATRKSIARPATGGPPGPGMPVPGVGSKSDHGSHLIPTQMGIALARIANEYVTGGGERNLHRALVELINFTSSKKK